MLFVVLAGCASEPVQSAAPAAASSGAESPVAARAPGAGMQVEGLMGTIPQRRIEETLHAKMSAFQRCFFDGLGEVEQLGGHFKFYFRVGLDGRVEWVSPRGSSVGHRATELCLLKIAQGVRFPEPKGGGPAEFVWGFEIDNPGGGRSAVAWPEARVAKTLAAKRGSLAACALGAGHYIVTVYVAPGGTVLGAGAAADSQPADQKIDCIVDVVKGWHMPDPGSYPAKVSFEL